MPSSHILCNIEKPSRSALSDLKHEAITECFRLHKARTTSFLNDFRNEPFYTMIREESLKINAFQAAKT